ncbi:unnamed protein product [Zymoseptoria tritici ST99CH_1E4]|uniref:Uncharacterized protein n=1 Tax=Zymoseptoria tritici ST99CH_1E4 TaxID=1276532 RepID=A0A2H1FMH0_ZYMTR|nr:unnamed protein product [Zymoseptoria tritici ST99CH_1E4]
MSREAQLPSRWHRLQEIYGKQDYIKILTIPDYLHGPHDNKHLKLLRRYYRDLSTSGLKGFINSAVWITGIDGAVPSETSDKTITEDLDIFQQKLCDSAYFQSTICCLNARMIAIPMSWNVNIRTPKHMESIITMEAVLLEMFRTYWQNSDDLIKKALAQMQQPCVPTWQPQYPSQSPTPVDDIPYMECRWLHRAPALEKLFGSYDWSLYINEPFAERPGMDTIRVIDMTVEGSGNARIIVITSSDHALTSVMRQYQLTIDGSCPQDVLDYQGYHLLRAVLNVAKVDLAAYISETTKRVNEIDMMCRRDSSTSIVQYLLHMRECHDQCVEACKDNVAIALRLRDEIHLPEGPHLETIRNGLQALALDLGYLSDELKSSMKKVDDVKKLAVDQMEIFDKRRNKVIGTLIAVYVPLAFATSFFSMSIEDNSAATTYWTNSTATSEQLEVAIPHTSAWYTGSNDTANSTSMTYTTADIPSRTVTWSMGMFWTVACSLVLGSIILPIVGGRVLRFATRLAVKHRRTFRRVASLIWLAGWSSAAFWSQPASLALTLLGAILASISVHSTFRARRFWSCAGKVVFISILLLAFFIYEPWPLPPVLAIIAWAMVLYAWTIAPVGHSW